MLTITEITDILTSVGFQITNSNIKKKELKSPDFDEFIYINKTAGDSPSSVIVHPNYLSMVDILSKISGVNHKDDFYHSSNLKTFPKKFNKGKTQIHYGIPFGFESENGIRSFIKALKVDKSNNDPFEDVRLSENDINSLSATERNALIKARIGQGPFRDKLINYWQTCAVTGFSVEQLLIASHIKPWRNATNQERLSVFNGFLLSPNLDKAFDKGLITFEADRRIIISHQLKNSDANLLGINGNLQLRKVEKNHMPFLEWHKNNIFKR